LGSFLIWNYSIGRVETTIVNGKILMEKYQIKNINEQNICEKAKHLLKNYGRDLMSYKPIDIKHFAKKILYGIKNYNMLLVYLLVRYLKVVANRIFRFFS
jgi:hypothetical protein